MTTENGSASAIGLAPPAGSSPRTASRSSAHRSAGSARVLPFARHPRAARTSSFGAVGSEALPRDHFVAQLRREMRRADRSQTPLSLVIYRLAQGAGAGDAATLGAVLDENKRETDILGQLGPDALALICTDTGEEGVHHFIRKIEERSGDLPYSVESATYPDHLFEGLTADPRVAHGPSPLILGGSHSTSRDGYFLKRPIDFIGALFALILLSPLMLLTAIAVKLTSRGPVIFRQTRLGQGGRPFAFFKFRSMVVNNDDRIHREYVASLINGQADAKTSESSGDDGLRYKIKRDPRITAIGRIIRKTSIDELPQLFNVLRGDMSLVGPRPPLPYEAENYRSWHLRRVLDIRPGITGLWQVEGRSRVSFDEMVRMDLRYIRSCSLGLDLRLLMRTVLVVLRCDGAA